ncbi:MAG: ketol-acid reductoisomerase [Candidatus Nezhaarchaeota archaeon]|nr:ketol-acid reductoisomerase [Candidatus Nezhaarchaeota archaeon]MCX8141434.1 ketol-acid reductoisomerase [Candidatus Nezhaarchaeota archaeon]MDW8049700.1 ketol-acid reductoisomerase [Nitrososphaerota archaeon]
MARIYRENEIDESILKGPVIAVVGYGSQGRAQALNLRDSGFNVVVGLRRGGKSWSLASSEGFQVYEIPEAVERGDVILFLIPDTEQPTVYEEYIKPRLSQGKSLCFAHGFNVHYEVIKPPKNVDVFMVAPKSPGAKVREMYLQGKGVPALVAVYNDYSGKALQKALAIAKGIGCAKAGVIETTFKEETETDLIGEQCVLVGGLMELIKKGFEVLVEEGYQPEVAYFEVCNEAKLIMDLIYAGGLTGMLRGVSETARYGGLTVGPKVIDERVKENMRKAVQRVRDGSFAKEWIEECATGRKRLAALMKVMESHKLEIVGKEMRKLAGIES